MKIFIEEENDHGINEMKQHIKYISSLNAKHLAKLYLEELGGDFAARSWILEYGYCRFKEFVEQLYHSKVLMTGASIIIFSVVLALGAPVSISAITAFALMFLIGNVVAKMLGDAVDTIILSTKKYLQQLFSRVENVDVSVKKQELKPIRKELIKIHKRYSQKNVFTADKKNDPYFNPYAQYVA